MSSFLVKRNNYRLLDLDTMAEIMIKTKKAKEVIDITDKIIEFLKNEKAKDGPVRQAQGKLVHLFLTHTTSALTISELDSGTDLDLLDALDQIIPKMNYRHSHNLSHMGSHIMSSLVGPSLTVPFNENGLILGTWQRVVLIEFDGPRERRIIISFL